MSSICGLKFQIENAHLKSMNFWTNENGQRLRWREWKCQEMRIMDLLLNFVYKTDNGDTITNFSKNILLLIMHAEFNHC